MFLAVFLALAPDFEFLVAFIGAFCMGLIAFVLPPLMYCSLLSSMARARKAPTGLGALCVHSALALLGTLVFLGSTYSVVHDKLTGEASR